MNFKNAGSNEWAGAVFVETGADNFKIENCIFENNNVSNESKSDIQKIMEIPGVILH